jgi:tetratricopeptide (TPR) repeat protein
MRAADPADFLGWVRERLLRYAAVDSPLHTDVNLGRAMAFAWARAVWNGLPLNAAGTKPRPMPEPGSDEPCPCGSGQRFRDCCQSVPAIPPLTQDVLWPYVLANVPPAERDTLLASNRIPRGALIEFAAHLLELHRGSEVICALEPRLAAPERYHDEDTAILLHLLCEAYGITAGGARRKLKLLLETTTRAPRSPLRSEAWQRLATIYMDRGDCERAWSAFHCAQHDNPQADELGALEVELLVAGDRMEEARQRAGEWAAALASHGVALDDPRFEYLSRMAINPADRSRTVSHKIAGAGAALRDWLLQVADREPARYQLVPTPSATRLALVTPRWLLRTQQMWHDVFPLAKPFSAQDQPFGGHDVWEPGTEAQWSEFLRAHPEAFESLDILDDLATAIGRHTQAQSPWVEALLLQLVLARSAELIDLACRDIGDGTLPWSAADNRTALRALFRLFQQQLGRDRRAAAIMTGEKLLCLNPDDEHGVRPVLGQLREVAAKE